MRDEDHGQLALHRRGPEQLHDDRLHRDVQRRGDLVANEHVRLGGQGPRDGDPLPLAAGQLIGVAGQETAAQGHVAEHLGHPVGLLGPGQAEKALHRLGHDLADRLPRVERGVRVLEHVLDLLQHRPRAMPGGVGQRDAAQRHLARPVLLQPGDAPGQCGLARAGLADHSHAAAGRHVQADTGQRGHAVVAGRYRAHRQQHRRPGAVPGRGQLGRWRAGQAATCAARKQRTVWLGAGWLGAGWLGSRRLGPRRLGPA